MKEIITHITGIAIIGVLIILLRNYLIRRPTNKWHKINYALFLTCWVAAHMIEEVIPGLLLVTIGVITLNIKTPPERKQAEEDEIIRNSDGTYGKTTTNQWER